MGDSAWMCLDVERATPAVISGLEKSLRELQPGLAAYVHTIALLCGQRPACNEEGAIDLMPADAHCGSVTVAGLIAGLEQLQSWHLAVLVEPVVDSVRLEGALGAAVDFEHADALPQAMERLDVQNLLLTLGANGMVPVGRDGALSRIATVAREVYDVSGAGDTVTAWAGTALASGASVREAAELANYAACIEVGKSGVAVVTRDEVLDLYERRFDQVGMFRRGGVL